MKWKELCAALMLFTRLPLWRFVQPNKEHYTRALKYWALTGYLTAAVTAGTLWLASELMPIFPACILAIAARLLFTGALHEDGLADFFDGFGGGNNREKILSIMKDSHIGCYGTIGLISYFLLYVSLLQSFDIYIAVSIIFMADCFSKLFTAIMINSLPYARKEEESKTGVLYNRIGIPGFIITLVLMAPTVRYVEPLFLLSLLPSMLCVFLLRRFLLKKIDGYTGDCCGATALITEQCIYLGAVIIYCL